jgi:SAM-dependent methyltransferase
MPLWPGRDRHLDEAPERIDVPDRLPRTKEECEHLARYEWAASQVHGEVLDLACGTGYGSRLLAHSARVIGVDRDEQSVQKARSRVSGAFLVAEVPPIPLASDAFDFVISFETVEHISDELGFVREIARVLRPGGTLLISSPNKDISAPDGVPGNRWHVREHTLTSLKTLLAKAGLQLHQVYGQSFPPRITRGHRAAWRLHGLTWGRPRLRAAARALLGDAQVRPQDVRRPAPGYWVLRARKPA